MISFYNVSAHKRMVREFAQGKSLMAGTFSRSKSALPSRHIDDFWQNKGCIFESSQLSWQFQRRKVHGAAPRILDRNYLPSMVLSQCRESMATEAYSVLRLKLMDCLIAIFKIFMAQKTVIAHRHNALLVRMCILWTTLWRSVQIIVDDPRCMSRDWSGRDVTINR